MTGAAVAERARRWLLRSGVRVRAGGVRRGYLPERTVWLPLYPEITAYAVQCHLRWHAAGMVAPADHDPGMAWGNAARGALAPTGHDHGHGDTSDWQAALDSGAWLLAQQIGGGPCAGAFPYEVASPGVSGSASPTGCPPNCYSFDSAIAAHALLDL